jgi:hypothetical protein
MTEQHKEALKLGRLEARALKAYLRALDARKPGRPVTRESLEARLRSVEAKIAESDDPLRKLELVQKKLDIEDSLGQVEDARNIADLEAGFVRHARSYSERKGISYTAWRQVGVTAATLKAAGITETRRR